MGEHYPLKRRYNGGETLSEESSDDGNDNSMGPPPQKKQLPNDDQNYSAVSLRMMKMMGHKDGTGLGKYEQGLREPIEASNQKGRRGFGLKLDDLDTAADKWTPDMEQINVPEICKFIADYSDDLDTKSVDELKMWMVDGSKKLSIEDEANFCDPDILTDVLAQKTVFDHLGADDMRNARTRCNPFETINNAIFLNRAAVKMANMDALFDFMFTNPKDMNGSNLVKENELLYFADVCAGPGGFSEYVLWRKKWHAKGFGFTLRCENDFKLEKFLAGPPETFDPFYGIKEDGNVYDPENIESLTHYVLKQTDVGVHFMMSDGGFSVEGQENLQEILSKQLYLCQCLTALSIVRVDGHFVTKLFDLFTPFSVGLIYLMYKCFKQICIVKPNTSRPANSERYLVCKWKKTNTDAIRQYLFDANTFLFENANTDADIVELVPYDVLRSDERFFRYIYESNNEIGRYQTAALLKIAHYSKTPNLRDPQQEGNKCKCLGLWEIPNQARTAGNKPHGTEQLFKELLGMWNSSREFIVSAERELTTKNIQNKSTFFDKSDWSFVPIDVVENTGKTIRTFFMSKGNADVYKYESNSWSLVRDLFVQIPANTLFYGEIVKELTGEGAGQTMVYALHIIDGIVLGGEDIRNYSLERRNRLCGKFAEALNKPPKAMRINSDTSKCPAPVRCKKLYSLLDMRRFFGSLTSRKLKDGKIRLGCDVRDKMVPTRFYVPRGIMIFKKLKPNLCRQFDARKQDFFYTDLDTKQTFELKQVPNPEDLFGSFRSTFTHRKLWKWVDPQQVEEVNPTARQEDLIYRVDFENFIYNEY